MALDRQGNFETVRLVGQNVVPLKWNRRSPSQVWPTVVPRRFENGSHRVSSRRLFVRLKLLVSVTSRAVGSRDNSQW